MDCTDIRPLISYYYDGEATPEERAQVEKHLTGCEDCRQMLAEYRAISGDIRDLPMPVPPVGLRRDVWRAIEARQAGTGARVFGRPRQESARPSRSNGRVVTFPKSTEKSFIPTFLRSLGSVPAALAVGAMIIMIGVLVIQSTVNVPSVALVDQPPYADYTKVVMVNFNKDVRGNEAKANTRVHLKDNGADVPTNNTYVSKIGSPGGILEIHPATPWEAGVTYEIVVDAPRIRMNVGNDSMGTEPVTLTFYTVAYTPVPTDTPVPPTATVIPTDTPIPTIEPTQIAENTPVPPAPGATDTPRPQPTSRQSNTPAPPSPSATRPPPPQPSATFTPTPIPPRRLVRAHQPRRRPPVHPRLRRAASFQ
jgi:Putative zinc-finger